ncbi:excinuclease ATPase subunit [Halomonas ramblicola]|uniref:excinuclease ATPase subunit n=1 Tax=Halomonas ramblicola TaxID=747349 RepID=UPI0025B30001|nr:excinuclease ATPase subunit [Halomonas ramblicola]MDN3521794.1 excinuclease ATPase subunit [Halomonas ramblicola]
MKKGLLSITALVAGLALATSAQARDTRHLLPIEEAMNTPEAREKLDPNIRFVFADTPPGTVAERHGNFVTNKKTNAFNKSDEEACRWVMLSALLSLQERVQAEGGNAVINIESFYKREPMVSRDEYECHAGMLMAGVALRGDVVTLR